MDEDQWECMNCTNWTAHTNDTLSSVFDPNLWCLILVLFPSTCIFGNMLVVLSVLSERSLKTSTNFLLVSLACADMLVGSLVMPFAIYLTINRLQWFLPGAVCNFFCVVDVSASTSSIVHLVAISIDRFYAVVRHMEYKSPTHRRRVYSTIVFSWAFSICIGLPLGIGLNQGSKEEEHECGIINPDYMLFSSIFAFYIPCIVMVIMYSFVFYKLHRRMRAIKLQEMAAGQMVQFGDNLSNILQHAYGNKESLRQASLVWAIPFLKTLEETIAENEDMSTEEWNELTHTLDMLHTLESDSQQHTPVLVRPMEEIPESPENSEAAKSPQSNYSPADPAINRLLRSSSSRPYHKHTRRPGPARLITMFYSTADSRCRHRERRKQFRRTASRTLTDMLARIIRGGGNAGNTNMRNGDADDRTVTDCSPEDTTESMSDSERRRRRSVYAAKRKIRTLKERAIALLMKLKSKQGLIVRKETRATKLVATVMLVFLICWTPFFTLNIIKVTKLRAGTWNYELESLFIFFTWMGYLNSCLNPIIYSLFNRKFRATFKRLLHWPRDSADSPLQRQRRLFSRPFAGPPDSQKTWFALSTRYSCSPQNIGQGRKMSSVLSTLRNGPLSSTKSLPPMPASHKRSFIVSRRQVEGMRQRKITWGTSPAPSIVSTLTGNNTKSIDQQISEDRADQEKTRQISCTKEHQNGITEMELLRRVQNSHCTQEKPDSFTEPVEV